MPTSFIRPALIQIDDGTTTYTLSDHNRSPLDEAVERLETSNLTWNGKRRRFHRGDIHKWSVSWDLLPARSSETVDGYSGADDLKQMYLDFTGDVTVTITDEDGTTDTYTAHITNFSRELRYRWDTYYYDVSLSLEAVSSA